LSGLTLLWLIGNPLTSIAITSLSPLVANSAFAQFATLYVAGEPLDCAAQATNIKALKDRGVTVSGQCP
jgi:internalin A